MKLFTPISTPFNRRGISSLLIGVFLVAGAWRVGATPLQTWPAGLPLAFEANRGQADATAEFLARGEHYSLFLTPGGGATLRLTTAANQPQRDAVLQLSLAGARADVAGAAQSELAGRVNYFIGNDPARWRRGIPTFGRVKFAAVYPGVDLIYHGNDRRLEYDFIVAPGADARQIALNFSGADGVRLGTNGDLALTVAQIFHSNLINTGLQPGGQWCEAHRAASAALTPCEKPLKRLDTFSPVLTGLKPGVNEKRDNQCEIPKTGETTRLSLTSDFSDGDRRDACPTIQWQRPIAWQDIGGRRVSVACEYALETRGQDARATTVRFRLGAYDHAQPLVIDPVLLYSTYLGGVSSSGDSTHAVTTDAAGNVYFTGTESEGEFAFPAAQNYRDTGGSAVFVTKLDSTGTNAAFTTFIGGSGNDTGTAIALDSAGHIYIAGNASSGFPITNGFQTVAANGFLAELSADGSNILYSTYIGDSVSGLGVDGSGNAVVAGTTSLASFPVTPGVLRTNPPSGVDPCGFVVKVNTTLSGTNSLVYSTLFGGSGYDSIQALAVNSVGDAFLTGAATSTNFPFTPGAFQTNRLGYSDVYVAELNLTGTALVFSTLLGGSGVDGGNSITLGQDGDIYVTGATGSKDFPVTPGAAQPTFGGGGNYSNSGDAFAAKFNPTGTALLWSTYLGGSLDDNGTGISVDSNRNVYVTGNTSSLNFPTRQPVQPPNLFDAFKLAAGATNWSGLAVGSQTINVFAVDPVNSSNVYAGTTRGGGEPVLYKSSDGGLTWSGSDAGMPANFTVYDGFSDTTINQSVKALAVDPSNPNVLYAGFSSGAGILKSTNAGASWFVVTNGLPPLTVVVYGGVDQAPVNALAVDPHNSQNIFAALGSSAQSGGVFRSANGGQSWSNVLSGSFQVVAIDPVNSLNVYAANNNSGGFYKSVDGGNTWTNLNIGLPSSFVESIAVNPASPDTIYAGTYANGIYESQDGGTNWFATGETFPGVPSLAFNSTNSATLYAVEVYQTYQYYGVIVSTNGGTNWTSLDTGIPSQSGRYYVASLTADPSGTLYAASSEYLQEGFVAKLDATGSLLVYGTYLGGVTGTYNSRAYNYANGIAVDNAGNAWVVGSTTATDFPVTTNAFQPTYNGNQSAFIAKLGSAASADVAVALTASASQTPANTSFSYTVVVTNLGPADATSVTLEDALPASLAFQSATLSQGSYQLIGQALICNFGTVSNGTSATLMLTVVPTLSGTVQNTVSATANETDPVLTNNMASATVTVQQNTALHTDLALGLSASPNPALLGYNLNYVLSVTNLGPDAASGVILTDALPAAVTVVSANASQGTLTQLGKNLTATFGNLAAGASASLNVVVTPLTRGSITNSAGVTGNESDPNPANNFAATATPVIVASLQVTRSGPVPEQADQSFTMFVTNVGPDAVANTVLTITPPDGTNTVLQLATPSQGSAVISNNLVIASFGTIGVGAGATIHVAASGPANVADYTLVEQASSSGIVLFTQTNSTVADLKVYGQMATPNPAEAGQTITLTGFVTNAGPDVAKNVTITFGLDSTAENLISMSASAGTTSSFLYGSVLYVNDLIPAMNPGTAAQFTVQMQAFLAVDEYVLFGATSDQPDPTPGDNSIGYDAGYGIFTNWIVLAVTNGPGVLSFAQASFSTAENSGAASISVIRQGGSVGTVSVNYATTGGSAKAGANYTPVNGTLTFAPGETSKTFTVPLLDDGVLSPDVSVNLALSGVAGGFLGVPTNATLTIAESDFPTNPVGNLQLVSAAITNSPLTFGNNSSASPPVMTPDGRYVVFDSLAANLVPGDHNNASDVFLRDLTSNRVTLVSVTRAGTSGNSKSIHPKLTPDGRYVAFESDASDLVTNAQSGRHEVFVRDLTLGQTKLVSLAMDGSSGNGDSYLHRISDDGRYVIFDSYATNLVPQATSGVGDVYARDLWSNVTYLVSVDVTGTRGGSDYSSASSATTASGITPDGRFILFYSYATNLTSLPNPNGNANIYVRDLINGLTTLVSTDPTGTQSGSSFSYDGYLTPDGRYVAFDSYATNLTAGITNGFDNVFLRDLASHQTMLVSLGTNGVLGNGNSYTPVVSSNGQFVVFQSNASNLAPGDANNQTDLFVRDTVAGTTRLVSLNSTRTGSANNSAGSQLITPDGRFVVFQSAASNVTTNSDFNFTTDVFIADLVSNTTTLVSVSTNGATGNAGSYSPVMTPDGRYVAFVSDAYNLAPNDSNFRSDIYRRDLSAQTTVPVSAAFSRTANNTSPNSSFSMSADGRWLAFDSSASNLTPNDTNGVGNIFLSDTLSNTLALVNLNTNGIPASSPSYNWSSQPLISADGNVVVFQSSAADLTTNPIASYPNLFVRNLASGVTSLVSVNTNGAGGNNQTPGFGDISVNPGYAVSDDGRYVAFVSQAGDLIPNDTNAYPSDVFLRDLVAGTTTLVSADANGQPVGDADGVAMSGNGRVVVFESGDSNILAGDFFKPTQYPGINQYQYDLFARDTVANTVSLVDATPSGGFSTNSFYNSGVSVSDDGRYVVFVSNAGDLVTNVTGGIQNVFVRDLTAGQTRLVSVNPAGAGGNNNSSFNGLPQISANDRYVAFSSYATDLAPGGGTNGDVFVRDLAANTTTLVSINAVGTGGGDAVSDSPVISSDGRCVTFQSYSTDLVPGAFAANVGNIYRRDLVNGVTLLISGNLAGTGGGEGTSERPAMSSDGSVIGFDSAAYDLTPQDFNQVNDLFVFGFASVSNTADLALGVTAPASASVGNNFSLTLTVTNLGPTNATGVAVVDTLPPGVNFVSANASQGTPVFGGGQVTWSLGNLGVGGGGATATITVTPTVAGIIYNAANVSGNQPDLNPYNNGVQTAVTVSGSSAPVLAIGRLSGSQFQISWNSSTNLELQTATNLAPPIVWLPATNGIVNNGGVSSIIVTNLPGGGDYFYRLATP